MVRNKDMCEICGKYPAQFVVVVEGATLRLCGGCARSGKIIERIGGRTKTEDTYRSTHTRAYKKQVKMSEEIVEDYASRIRKKRQELRIPVSVVAERIKEKESYLHGIENNSIKPSLNTARKLEKLLEIEIVEQVEAEPSTVHTNKKRKTEEPSLGDYLSG